MARDGGGVYSKPAGTTAVLGTTIESGAFNTLMDDIAADLNVDRPVVAGGTGASDAATARANLGVSVPMRTADTTGSSNAYAVTTDDAFASLTDGDTIEIVANHSNTGAATINVDTLGAKNIQKVLSGGVTALVTGDLIIGGHYTLSYDASVGAGTWIVQNPTSVIPVGVTGVSGLDADLITGTAGTNGNLSQWNADGDLVDGPGKTGVDANVVTGTAGTNGNLGAWNADGDLVDGGAAPVLTKSFTSAEQTITTAGTLSLAHSLSAMPAIVQCRLICKTTEGNYSVDDEVVINPGFNTDANSQGLSVVPDSTNVVIRFASNASAIKIINKTTGDGVNITNGNWRLIVRAWA